MRTLPDNVSYRQLDSWVRLGLLRPRDAAAGSGRPRDWSDGEWQVLLLMGRLTAAGLSPRVAERVARGETTIGPGIRVVITSEKAPFPDVDGVRTSENEQLCDKLTMNGELCGLPAGHVVTRLRPHSL